MYNLVAASNNYAAYLLHKDQGKKYYKNVESTKLQIRGPLASLKDKMCADSIMKISSKDENCLNLLYASRNTER